MALLLWIITVDAPILFQNTVDERDVEFQACLLTSVGWLRQIFSLFFSILPHVYTHKKKKCYYKREEKVRIDTVSHGQWKIKDFLKTSVRPSFKTLLKYSHQTHP